MQRTVFILLLILFLFPAESRAVWIWTPETNKWINPKYSVKDTPKEQLQVVADLFDGKNYTKAIAEARKLLRHYPKAKQAAEAQYYIGRSFEALENLPEAHKAYQLVIDKYPFSDRSAEIVERQFNIAETILNGKANKSKWAAIVGDNYQVIDIYRTVIKNAPYGKYAPQAQYKIGLYLKEKGLYQEARDEFEKTMNDYPKSEWAKAAKYQIAVVDAKRSSDSQRQQKVTQIAVDEFKDFISAHPNSELSDQAKDQIKMLRDKDAENNFVIAEFYEKQKNLKAAKIYYSTVVDDYSESPWAAKALARIQALGGK